ncbi:MAG: flavodoxin domain-containing protein [Gammaproteobacteria bacterium]|nr:flavodoxin domain-containing protein [Gammaproteobacteria bacterium]
MQATGEQHVSNEQLQSLSGPELGRLLQAIEGLSTEQLNWASGYLAGISAGGHPARPVSTARQSAQVTILYASQTGNARSVAQRLADAAAASGIESRLLSAHEFKARRIADERLLILVVSTQGEGEVPENAESLYNYLTGRKPPDLSKLEFAVFGLGDSSYTHFCKAGVDFDQALEKLGGRRILERLDADVDFDSDFSVWLPNALQVLENRQPARQAVVLPLTPRQSVTQYNRDKPYPASLIENRRLTTDQALTDVHHLVLEIDPAAISYQAGDSLGVWFRNDPAQVDEILGLLALDGNTHVRLGDKSLSLSEALLEKRELSLLHPKVVSGWARHTDSGSLDKQLADKNELRRFAAERRFIDLIEAFPGRIEAQQLVDLLGPLQPRLYSIASSPAEYADEIHLTVSALQYEAHGRRHRGAASAYLSERLKPDDNLDVYVVDNDSFRLPDDPSTPVIMIGAGTGIAPFRSFLQQRASQENPGRNWLIFGNRHFHDDFLYQTDWIEHRRSGVLEKVSVAFSRDSEQRNYVQDRLFDEGPAVLEWLAQGAHIYVCGAIDMEKGVAESLQRIAIEYAGKTRLEAEEFYQNLRHQKRYLRDVY